MSTQSHPGLPGSAGQPNGGDRRSRRPRLGGVILLSLLLLPVIEIVTLIAVGQTIGVWWTIGLLLGMSVLGAVLMKTEGRSTWRALDQAVRTGRMPAKEATDATLVLAGGLLLLLPGFVTDLVGLVLILPFTRPVVRRALHRRAENSVMAQAGVVRSVTVTEDGTMRSTTFGSDGRTHRPSETQGEIVEGIVVDEGDDRRRDA